jgi:hypothetical protein
MATDYGGPYLSCMEVSRSFVLVSCNLVVCGQAIKIKMIDGLWTHYLVVSGSTANRFLQENFDSTRLDLGAHKQTDCLFVYLPLGIMMSAQKPFLQYEIGSALTLFCPPGAKLNLCLPLPAGSG